MVVKYFVAVNTGDKTGYVVDVEVRENVYMSAVEEKGKVVSVEAVVVVI